MNAVSLQFFLLPSQLEFKSGIGGACEGSCCLSQSAFHDWPGKGSPCTHHLLELLCLTVLNLHRSLDFEWGWEEGFQAAKVLIKWKSVVCLILQGLLCRVDTPCLGVDKLLVLAGGPRIFTRPWVGIWPRKGWFLSTLTLCSYFLNPGVKSIFKMSEVSKEILIHTLKAQSLNNFLPRFLMTSISARLASL